MNYVGWVPLRRGIIAHAQDGRLSNTECLVLIFLIMLAHKETGAGTINAPSLRAFLPGISYDSAKRVLLSLEEKRYIFREIVPFSKHVYRFWVHRYVPTVGKYKSLQCCLAKAFETRDVKDIEYVQPAPGAALEAAPEDAPDTALHYNKDKNKDKRENPPDLSEKSVSDTMQGNLRAARQRIAQHTQGPASALPDATTKGAPVNSTQKLTQPDKSPEAEGLRWSGHEGAFLEIATGRVLTMDESVKRLGAGVNRR